MEEQEKEENSEIMKIPILTEDDLTNIMKNLRNGKVARLDGMTAEMMKCLLNNQEIRKHAIKCFNRALYEEVHDDWLRSNTTMIPKTSRPRILEHTPIAVMVFSSKIIFTLFREKIEHLKERRYGYENLYSFTKGGKIEHCLYVLDYVANMSYESSLRNHKSLF